MNKRPLRVNPLLLLSFVLFWSTSYQVMASRGPSVDSIMTIDLEQKNQNKGPHDTKKTSFDFSQKTLSEKDQYRLHRFNKGRIPQSEIANSQFNGRNPFVKDLLLIVLLLVIPFSSMIMINRKLMVHITDAEDNSKKK